MIRKNAGDSWPGALRPGQTNAMLKNACNQILKLEPLLLVAAAPFLLFPFASAPATAVALALLPISWGCRWKVTGHVTRPTVIDSFILTLLALLPVGLWASTNRQASLPKLTIILLGVALYYFLVNRAEDELLLSRLTITLVLLTAAICLLALVGTDWFSSKLLTLDAAYGHLPRWIHNVPRSVRAGGFHPNEVGGTLAILIPIMLAATVASRYRNGATPGAETRAIRPQVWTIATVLVLVTALLSLILTQSRGAILATAVALIPLALGLRRRILLLALLPIAAIILWAGGQMVSATRSTGATTATAPPLTLTASPSAWLISLDRSTAGESGRSSSTWDARVEIWGNAWEHLWDYPFTGSGLATFTAVSKANYPYDKVDPRFPITHAHNLYLQVGTDFGWFGLIAFLAICVLFFLLAAHAYRNRKSPPDGWYVRGLVAGIVGYLAFGFFDAITLGAKPSIIFWMALGGVSVAAADWGHNSAWSGRVRRAGGGIFLLALLFIALTLFDMVPARANRGALRLDRVLLADNLQPEVQAQMTGQALADLSGILALPGAQPGIWRRIGQGRLLLGDETQALAAWQHDDRAYPFLLWKGRIAEVRADWQEATRDYVLATRLRPEASRAFYRQGRVLQAQGQSPAAQRAFQKALALNDFDQNVAEQADTYRRLGQILAGRGEWEAARDAFQQAVTLEPDAPTLLALGWSVYRATGDVVAAQADFRRAVALEPDNPFYALGIGKTWISKEQWEPARYWIRYLQENFPHQPWSLLLTGELAMEQKSYTTAQHSFEQVVSLAPGLASGHWWLGQAYGGQELWEQAIRETKEAATLDPEYRFAWLALGDFYRRAGQDLDKAVQAYHKMLTLDPNDSIAFQRIVQVYQEIGNTTGLHAEMDWLVTVAPGRVEAWELRGRLAYENGDYVAAVESFRHLVLLQPDSASGHWRLGQAYGGQELWEQAIRETKEAATLDPEYRFAWLALGDFYRLSGQDRDKAVQAYHKMLTIDPNDTIAHERLRQMGEE